MILGMLIHEHGFWLGIEAELEHRFHPGLCASVIDYLKLVKAKDVVDLGCGMGRYVREINDAGIYCEGFDGNPDTSALTRGTCTVLDLSKSQNMTQRDWVISLEVGEHIPSLYEGTYLDNVANHSQTGIILSWAVKGQGGEGHVNEQSNEYVSSKMNDRRFERDELIEIKLRESASLWWFHNSLMIFTRMK